jgi:hypothetical protein
MTLARIARGSPLVILIWAAAACEPTEAVVARAAGAATDRDASIADAGAETCAPPRVRARWTNGTDQETCPAALGEAYFRHALCTCADAGIDALSSDGFDSTTGVFVAGAPGGAVGVNGSYTGLATSADIGDRFSVAGTEATRFLLSLRTSSDLELAGGLALTGRLDVGQDARIGGSLTATTGSIARDLYVPESESILGAIVVGGITQRTPVVVEAPCPCGPDALLDVAAMVADARVLNDNTLIGLDTAHLRSPENATLSLPCGRFFVDGTLDSASLMVQVNGKAALFVDGDLVTGPDFATELEPEAELDVFVSGNLVLSSGAELGDRARPGATRVYVGGAGAIAPASTLVGAIYAPAADVTIESDEFEILGALLSRSIDASTLAVHHDRAALAGCEFAPEAK